MENQGIHIDENVLDEIGAKTDTILESLTQQIYEMAHMSLILTHQNNLLVYYMTN